MKFLQNIFNSKNNKIRKPHGHDVTSIVKDFQENVEEIIHEWENYVNLTSSYGKPIDEISELQKDLNRDKKWSACFLFVFGKFNKNTVTHFPKTTAIIKKNKHAINLVFFSSLEPNKHIHPHTGNNHGVVRTQFGIDIREPEMTGLRVADKTIQLKNKEMFTFDDTFEHEAWNKSQEVRTVLIIDTYKKLPFFYDQLNKFLVKKMKTSEHIKSVIQKMNKHE